jgi:cytoskeletal protein RodZ
MADRDKFDDFEDDDQDDGFLTFDARDEEEDRSRGPLVIAAIVVVLALCGVILWQLYAGSRDGGDTPQVAADSGSFKSAPAQPGGTETGDLDKSVYDAASGSEAPPLAVQPSTSGADDPLLADGAALPDPAAVPAAPAATPRPAPVQAAPAPAPQRQVAAVAPPPPRPVAQAAPAPQPAPKPAEKPKAAPVQVAAVTPPRPAPAATPAPAPAPVAAAPAPKVAAPAPARPSSGGIAAQLGSFQTRAAADTALARYRASGLSGPVSVVAADLGAKGTWYRIRATGFDNRTEVNGFCAKARSAGAQCVPSGQ